MTFGLVSNTGLVAMAESQYPLTEQGAFHRGKLVVAQARSRLKFKVSGIKASDNRVAGAARGGCPHEDKQGKVFLTALLPQASQVEVESTVADRPTFFVAVPQTSARLAEFLLLKVIDEDSEEQVYQATFPLTSHSGIVGFHVPKEAPALLVGQKYHWSIKVLCNSDVSDQSMIADGLIQRVKLDPTLAQQLDQVDERARAKLYSDAGIWTDTLTTAAELLKANPRDSEIAEDWASLLESVNLKTVAQEPLVQITSNVISSQQPHSGYSSQMPNPNSQNSKQNSESRVGS